jgi:hypothetical protein
MQRYQLINLAGLETSTRIVARDVRVRKQLTHNVLMSAPLRLYAENLAVGS